MGGEGYLADKGLVPLSAGELAKVRATAAAQDEVVHRQMHEATFKIRIKSARSCMAVADCAGRLRWLPRPAARR